MLENGAANEEKKVEKPINAVVKVEIVCNYKEADVIVSSPEFGGKDISYDEIKKELSVKGVCYGIDEAVINQIVNQKIYNRNLVIAKCKEPEDGTDGKITYKFDTENKHKPHENDDGTVNYKDLGLIRNIKKGTYIADIVPPTMGEPGIDVRDRPIAQKKGVKAKYSLGQNTKLNGAETAIIAMADGNLRFSGGAFHLDTTFTVPQDIDSSTGNIDFIGDVIVKGNILEGFAVKSGKSVTVHGDVNGAKIEAEESITIKLGCINSKIIANGNIKAGFFENADIKCKGDVQSKSFSFCKIFCEGKLIAGGTREQGGVIVGGEAISLLSIEASIIGSRAFTKTLVVVGQNALLSQQYDENKRKIAEIDNMISQYTKAIEFLNAKKKELGSIPKDKEGILSDAIKSRIIRLKEKNVLQKKLDEIQQMLQQRTYHDIKCTRTVYPGVKVKINDASYLVEGTYSNCKFCIDKEDPSKIVMRPC